MANAPNLQNPTFGKIKTKTPETVTSVNFLSTVEADGSIAKIAPVNLGFASSLDVVTKKTISQIRSLSGAITNPYFYTTDLGQEGNWHYDASDTTSADNTGTVLVTSDGKRIKRIIQNRTIDPNWFGLKGDNSFDNTTLLKNMITSLGDGFVYEFKTGTYVLSDYIPVPNKITVKGLGNVIFKQTTNYKTIFNVTVSECNFDNFTTQQTGKSQETNYPYGYGAGITFFRVKSGYANNIRCYDSGDASGLDVSSISGAGIYISGSDNIKISNCSFYNCEMGINLDDYLNVAIGNPARFTCNYNDIQDSYFEDCNFGVNYDYGGLGGGTDFIPGVIYNCKFVHKIYGKSAVEAKMYECRKPLLITNPQCVGRFGQAIAAIFGSYNMQVLGGYIDGSYDGVVLYQQPSQAPTRNVKIKGTVITNSVNAGVVINGALDSSIEDCEIANNSIGISITGFSWNTQLTNNNIHDNLLTGIDVREALGCKITGGYITNNSTDVSGTQSGIIVNQGNVDGRITDLEINNVTFDYSFQSSDVITATNQVYALKTIGNYYTYSVKTVPGVVSDNYFGRCTVSDSKTEISGVGLVYRGNGVAGSKLIDFPQLLNIKNRKVISGTGSPESVLSGSAGDVYIREDGGLKTSLYVKTTGSATTTGWTPFVSFTEPVVTDMNNVLGFSLIRTTNSCANTPTASAFYQGIQFSASSNDLYANQIVYDIQGNCYERQKDNGTWSGWRSRDSSKFTKLTSTSSSIFSGSRNQIIIQDSATLLNNPLIVDGNTFAGQTKLFKNKGVGSMVLAPAVGVTIDGSGSSITLAQNEVLLIICNGSNSYETVYRENISLKENSANKSDSFTVSSSTTYASTKALVDGLASISGGATSGTYTPTATPVSNVTSIPTPALHTYTKVGNIVTVYGYTVPVLTAGSVNSEYTITLPIARATGSTIVVGFGTTNLAPSTELIHVAVNSESTTTAVIRLTNTTIGSVTCRYSFQYDITM